MVNIQKINDQTHKAQLQLSLEGSILLHPSSTNTWGSTNMSYTSIHMSYTSIHTHSQVAFTSSIHTHSQAAFTSSIHKQHSLTWLTPPPLGTPRTVQETERTRGVWEYGSMSNGTLKRPAIPTCTPYLFNVGDKCFHPCPVGFQTWFKIDFLLQKQRRPRHVHDPACPWHVFGGHWRDIGWTLDGHWRKLRTDFNQW